MIKGYRELPDDVKKYVPDYEYLIYDLSSYTDDKIKLLTKKFGKLPEDMRNKMSELELENLEIIIESIFDYESLEDVKKYI